MEGWLSLIPIKERQTMGDTLRNHGKPMNMENRKIMVTKTSLHRAHQGNIKCTEISGII